MKPPVFDSRLVTQGDTFVAIPGVKTDGATFVADAVRRGASTVVCAADAALPPLPQNVVVVRTPNPRRELARLAAVAFGDPSRHLQVYAVTGTNGKTTIAGIVRDILVACGSECGLLSTVEYSWPGHREEALRTTPDPVAIQRMFASMAAAGCTAASMEASSHSLDQERVSAVTLAAAGFTNLTQDHFDYHKGFEDYYLCKRKLFEHLGEASPGAPAVVNADDSFGRRLLADCKSLPVRSVAYSVESAADVFASGIAQSASGSEFTLHAFGESFAARTPLIGLYNISNILCAIGMTAATGMPLARIVKAIAAIGPRWGRLEPIDAHSGARIFVDYAHTPDAIARALAALRPVTSGRLIAVFGCGGDRDRSKRPKMARAAAQGADLVFVTSDNPRSEDPEAIIDDAVSGFEGFATPWKRITDRREAIATAIAGAHAGDSVLIAGKGHENYQEAGGVRTHFDDREIARVFASH